MEIIKKIEKWEKAGKLKDIVIKEIDGKRVYYLYLKNMPHFLKSDGLPKPKEYAVCTCCIQCGENFFINSSGHNERDSRRKDCSFLLHVGEDTI